jgi:hypothetical protein
LECSNVDSVTRVFDEARLRISARIRHVLA